MLFDSDVLIWLTRGHAGAGRAVEGEAAREVSIISIMELFEGARDRRDMQSIKDSLRDAGLTVLPLSEGIGHRAATLMEQFVLSSGLDPADAIIAATAIDHDLPLCTANQKHFKAIAGLSLKVFRP